MTTYVLYVYKYIYIYRVSEHILLFRHTVFEVPQEVALKQLLVFFAGLATLRTLESPPCQDHGSRHPYARIAAEYAVAPGHSRPKLLGLTASPGETLEQTRRLLKQLQATSLNSVWNWLKNWLLEVPASFFFFRVL